MELPKDNSGLNLQVAPQKSNNKLYLILAAVLLVVGIGFGVFSYFNGAGEVAESEAIPSLKKASGGLQGKIKVEQLFLKIEPKTLEGGKKDKDIAEYLEKKAKNAKHKSEEVAEFTFNDDNRGLYLFFPTKDTNFKKIRDSVVSVDSAAKVDIFFASWDAVKGQWVTTEQNYFDKTNIRELESEDDLEKVGVVKRGQGVIIASSSNILIPGGHDSLQAFDENFDYDSSEAYPSFDWMKSEKGWVLINANKDTLASTFPMCANRLSNVFVQANAKTADLAGAFTKVDLKNLDQFYKTKLDKGFYAVWAYVNDEDCKEGEGAMGNAGAEADQAGNADGAPKLTKWDSSDPEGQEFDNDIPFTPRTDSYQISLYGNNLSYDQKVTVEDEPSIKFDFEGKISDTEFSYTMVVDPKTTSGVKKIYVTTDAGKSNALEIKVGKPKAEGKVSLNPEGVKVDSANYPDYLALTWSENAEADWYGVYYVKSGETNFAKLPDSSDSNFDKSKAYVSISSVDSFEAKIYNLPAGEYDLKVVGLDKDGNAGTGLKDAKVVESGVLKKVVSDAGAEDGQAAPVKPTEPFYSAVTFQAVTLHWENKAPGYRITSWVGDCYANGEKNKDNIDADTAPNQVTWDTLDSSTVYSFTVAAASDTNYDENTKWSPESECVEFKTFSLNPDNVVVDSANYPDHLKLTWSENADANWYGVYYAKSGEINFAKLPDSSDSNFDKSKAYVSISSVDSFEAKVYNLPAGQYDLKVAGLNKEGSAGNGLDDATVVKSGVLNSITAPDAPSNLGVLYIADPVTVFWDAPANNGGAEITDYLISYTKGGCPSDLSYDSYNNIYIHTTELKYNLNSLKGGTKYGVWLKASNGKWVNGETPIDYWSKDTECVEFTTTGSPESLVKDPPHYQCNATYTCKGDYLCDENFQCSDYTCDGSTQGKVGSAYQCTGTFECKSEDLSCDGDTNGCGGINGPNGGTAAEQTCK